MQLWILLTLVLTSCVTAQNAIYKGGCLSAERRPQGVDKDQCLSDMDNEAMHDCFEWSKNKYPSYERCKLLKTDKSAQLCEGLLPNEVRFQQCMTIDKDPELKACALSGQKFKSREDCSEYAKDPRAYKCKIEVAQNGGKFYECMSYYENKDAHAQQERNREQDRREAAAAAEAEADAKRRRAIADGINRAFNPKEKTTCTSKRQFDGSVETECSH